MLLVANANCQSMYKMESLPIYDYDGNLYQLRQVFDHIPTHTDTIEFNRDMNKYIYDLDKAKNKSKQYKAIVSQVKTYKDQTIIKPNSKFKSDWYIYYDSNVKVGDTIFISKEDAIKL